MGFGVYLFFQAMNKSGEKKFLIDGFPRNEDNLQGWNRVMEGKADVKCVLFFECSEDVSTWTNQNYNWKILTSKEMVHAGGLQFLQ